MNIVITGPKHCGKSTVISKIINLFSGSISGFITEFDNRLSTERELRIRSIDGSLSYCAVKWSNGKNTVYSDIFDNTASDLIDLNKDLVIIDELGKFEKDCAELENAVCAAFSSATNMLVSIRLDAAGWMQNLKSRDDVLVISVSESNRNELPAFILDQLMNR